jgi:hypothetical protein
MGTKKRPSAYEPLHYVDQDEPLFVLIGRDPDAGRLVRDWAAARERRGEDPAVVRDARETAAEMDAYCLAHGKKPLLSEAEQRSADLLEQAAFEESK